MQPDMEKNHSGCSIVVKEDVFNSIVDELAGSIHGHAFDKQKQIQEYLQVNASPDGDCGEKVYQYIIKNRD